MSNHDVIVVGVGGMGSATAYHLAKRGLRVLGLERFDIPHSMGSSHGITRIIRMAYFENPAYIPLLRRAYALWRELEAGFGEKLLHITGSIDASPGDHMLFLGAKQSCEVHDLKHRILDAGALTAEFPAYRVPRDTMAVFQADGGFLHAERCVVAHVSAAMAAGAEIHGRERLLGWEHVGGGVRVLTDKGSYKANKLVFTAGAWSAELLDCVGSRAAPERQAVAWLNPIRRELFQADRFPVFILGVEEGLFYGFPEFHIPGLKLGLYRHLRENIAPDAWEREPNARDEAVFRAFAERYLPDGAGPTLRMQTCMFTNTSDEDFIIDLHPNHSNVVVGAGFSGHGFKFCSVVGEILADLAENGGTDHDISRFKLSRFN